MPVIGTIEPRRSPSAPIVDIQIPGRTADRTTEMSVRPPLARRFQKTAQAFGAIEKARGMTLD